MKLGEALVRATRNCGELVPRYSQHLLSALLTGVKDPEPLVRASSLSNLGDVCQLLRFSLGPVVHEVSSSKYRFSLEICKSVCMCRTSVTPVSGLTIYLSSVTFPLRIVVLNTCNQFLWVSMTSDAFSRQCRPALSRSSLTLWIINLIALQTHHTYGTRLE